MITIYIAAIIIGMAIILSVYLQTYILRDKETPLGVTIMQGLLAITGLTLILIYYTGDRSVPIVSTLTLSIAAFGSCIMIYRDIIGKGIPKWLGLFYSLTSLIGFAFLLDFMFY